MPKTPPARRCNIPTLTGAPCGRKVGPRGCPDHRNSRPATTSATPAVSPGTATIDPMAPTHTRTLPEYHLDCTKRRVREILRFIDQGDLAVDPPYQRGSVWTDEQRVNLVKSLQMGLPLHALIIADRGVDEAVAGRPQLVAVDGRQRIETFRAWYDSRIAAPAEWFDADEVDPSAIADDGTITHSGLTDLGRRMVENRWLIGFHEVKGLTLEQEADLYLLVNFGGVAQTDEDRARAAAHGSKA